MLNALPGNTDEDRLRRLLQKLRGQKTDAVRLWQRIGQTADGSGMVGGIATGLEAASGPSSASLAAAYTPASAPTTTAAPTTSTTTTPAPATWYLYPIWDFSKAGSWIYSTGSTIWDLLDDSDGWPEHTDNISLGKGNAAEFACWLMGATPFSSLVSAELEIYVKNELANVPLTFAVEIIADDQVTPITDGDAITGVGTSEGSYSLRTCSLTLNADAQDWLNWIRPTLGISLENDTDAGSPKFFISAARVKLTYIPEF